MLASPPAFRYPTPMTYPTASPRQRLTGIALMCGAVACFGCLDATGKYLNLHMNTMEVVWARYASGFVLAFAISNPLTKPGIMITSRPLLQLTRSVLMLSGALLNFVALRYLQMDQIQSIVFSTPFLVSALAGPMLGEWIGWRRWIAIVVGFMLRACVWSARTCRRRRRFCLRASARRRRRTAPCCADSPRARWPACSRR